MRTAVTSWLVMVTLVVAGCLTLAACAPLGVSSAPATPAPAALSCTRHDLPEGIDVIRIMLRCTVTGAARDETGFSLKFTLTPQGPKGQTFSTPCSGALQHGAGSCDATYTTIVNFTFGSSSVAGELLPTHRSLGPLTPALAP
jgi:hypothetical protein